MTKPIPTAAELREQCSGAYQDALTWAQREIRNGCFRSRGKWVRVLGVDGSSLLENGEIEWKGTQRQLDALVAQYVGKPEVEDLYIEGGIDWSDNVRNFYDGDYTPWVTDWTVVIWSRNNEETQQ